MCNSHYSILHPQRFRIIISGGGTGGHIYPAVSIANALKKRCPDINILFVGAQGRMEMEKIPAAGYNIVGLPVAGLQRRLTLKNLMLPFKIWKSVRKATSIIKEFEPDVVIGVGGYASGPVLWAAERRKIPVLLQEQNSLAGITNKILAKRASKICVAYEGMDRFFPKEKIVLTGNPVRQDLRCDGHLRDEAALFFGLDPKKKTVLVVGGSLGARTLNLSMTQAFPGLAKDEVQWIWQTGKDYFPTAQKMQEQYPDAPVSVFDFIYRMDYAFAAADVVVSRAGAGTISELCVVAKPCLFVPSPNVSEDHQAKNAQALVDKNAAMMMGDEHAVKDLIPAALQLVHDDRKIAELKANIANLAKPNAAEDIVNEVLKLIPHGKKEKYEYVYFIGIGGIGMSALARYYNHEGLMVAGYDRTSSPLTEELEHEGIAIHYEDDLALVPDAFKTFVEKVLVVYTPAVPETHSELQYFRNNGYKLIKRSAALGHIAAEKDTLAVAGTHGKTTTTTLLAHLMTQAGGGCTAFLGGISKNYNSNLIVSKSNALVAEADEFDRSFLQLFPQIAIITSADADHLDIYGTADEMEKAFMDFASQVKDQGTIIVKLNVDLPLKAKHGQKIYRYAYDKVCNCYAANIRQQDNGLMRFDIHLPDGGVMKDCTLGVPGWINVENAIAATTAAWVYGADMKGVKKALESFTGVQRRFDMRINMPGCTYIDDYAHHPEELKAAITSLRETCPGRKITGIFQPHLYTRTRDFAAAFADSLDLLDRLILLDIYPARELQIPGVSSQIIFDKMKLKNKILCTKADLMGILNKEPIDVLVTFGAGDIDRLVKSITDMLNKRLKNELEA